MTHFETRAEAVQAINAIRGARYGETHFAQGNRRNGVDYWLVAPLSAPLIARTPRDVVPGATKKLSITDRAVMLRIKGMTREQVIASLIDAGATKESARATSHFVFTDKVSKAHRDMIAAGKWVGYSAR